MAMNKQRRTSNLANIVVADSSGNVTLPGALNIATADALENSTKVPTIAWVRTHLTGLSIASTGYVDQKVADLVASAPATLDTLDELAAALGDDANFATTVATNIASKVPNTRTITINGVAYDLSADRSWSIAGGVTSFNTRLGDIVLLSSDVTTALGYTPYNSTNPSGYISGITSLMVTTALGYTPYNATNPSGYTTNTGTVTSVAGDGTVSGLTLTGTVTTTGSLTLGGTLSLTSGQITTGLGYTPYNSTNPSGYITSSASITGSAGSTPTLTGSGSLTTQSGSGTLIHSYAITSSTSGLFSTGDNSNSIITFNRHPGDYYSQLGFNSTGTIFYRSFNAAAINTSVAWKTLLDSTNYNSYAPTLTGGGASGIWGISISGNSATTTLAANSTLWSGFAYLGTDVAVNGYMMGYGVDEKWHPIGQANLRTFLGLGSAAYITASSAATASTVVTRDTNAYVFAAYYNATANQASPSGSGLTSMIGRQGSLDNFYYDFSAAAVQSFLGLGSMAYSSTSSYVPTSGYTFGTTFQLGTMYVSTGEQFTPTTLLGVYSNGYAYKFPVGGVQSWLGLGSNAYTSTAFFYNGMIYSGGVSSADANTVHPVGGFSGSYSTSGWLTNGNNGYGGLITYSVDSNNDLQLQYTNGHGGTSNNLFFRSKNVGGWTSWKTLATTADLGSYLALSGGTMSGKITAPSTASDTYGGAFEIRERAYVSNTQSDWSYSPAISFHWGNRFSVRLGFDWNGYLALDNVRFLNANNYTSYSPSLTGTGASGTWGINVTGSAGSVAWTNVSGRPTAVSSFTNDSGYITSSALSPYLLKSGGTMSGTLTLASISGAAQTVSNTYGAYLHLGDWAVARTAAGAVLVNTAYRADYATDLFDMNISRFTNNSGYITGYTETDTLATVTSRGSSTAQNITFSNGRKGLVGVYDAAQTQAIFAMGAAYVLTDGGGSATIGNLYGLAWSYNPGYGGAGNNPQSISGLNHQMLLMQAGVTTAAFGSGIWTSGNISAANFSGSHSGTSSGTNTGDQTNISGNAGTVGGLSVHTGTNNEANKIVRTEANGYVNFGWINTVSGVASGTPSRVYCSEDAYIRYYSMSTFTGYVQAAASGTWGISVSGNAATATSASSASTSSQVTINYSNDSNSTYQMLWGSGNSVYGTGGIYCNPATDTLYATTFSGSLSGNASTATSATSATNATNATNGRYVYDNGTYSGGAAYREASSMHVYYASLGRTVYNNGAYSGSGWIEPSDLGVRYANSAGSATSAGYATSAGSVSDGVYLSGTQTITGIKYFQTNNGAYIKDINSAGLQAFCTGGNAAFMSFHRSGNYAVNFGLDADNVLRMGGWSAGANNLWQLDMSGNMTALGDVTAYSDARVKTDVKTIENALSKTIALRGVSYTRTDIQDKRTKIGVIAQETMVVVPEVVNQDNAGIYNVSYGNMAGLFIEAFKELAADNKDLREQVNELRKLIN